MARFTNVPTSGDRTSLLELDTGDDAPAAAPAPTQRQPIPTLTQRQAAPTAIMTSAGSAVHVEGEPIVQPSLSANPPTFEMGGNGMNAYYEGCFRRSRAKFEANPTLPELARSFGDRIRAEQRKDLLVDAPTLHVLDDGRLDGFNGQAHLMSGRALDGLATHVTPGGAGYLRACPPSLRATNLNHWLGSARQIDARATKKAGHEVSRDRQLTLRTRARKDGRTNGATREVYSVVGPRYASYDVDQVMTEAAKQIGNDARGVLTYNGYKMTLDAMFHTNIAPANTGEVFKGAVRVQAADDGTGAVKVSLGLWRCKCRNLTIVAFDKVLIGSRKHVGSVTIASDIAELLATANERIDLIVGKWCEATTENVLARYDLQDVDEVFRGLVLNKCVTAPNVKPEDMVKRLHEAWEREPGYNKTAILNAITRSAHEQTWSSWADAEELESQAGELLYQPVWNLDYSERTAEQILSA